MTVLIIVLTMDKQTSKHFGIATGVQQYLGMSVCTVVHGGAPDMNVVGIFHFLLHKHYLFSSQFGKRWRIRFHISNSSVAGCMFDSCDTRHV